MNLDGEKSSSRRLVSVIIPVYRGEQFVSKAIESALAQTHPSVEVIAVNDGCPGHSLDVLNRYATKIQIVSQDNCGVARARNAGIRHSKGEFIAFLDQDDYWLATKLEQQLKCFDGNPSTGLVHTGVQHIESASGKKIPPLNPQSDPDKLVGRCLDRLLMNNAIYNSSVMVSRRAIDLVGMCNESIAGNTVADFDLWLRIAREFDFGFVSQKLTHYRTHPNQGLLDRRSMLEAELSVLLSIPENGGWATSKMRRQKLSSLYDELAVAYADSGEWRNARRYFRRSFITSISRKTFLRMVASFLPPQVLSYLR